jgi:protein gp37
MSDKTGIEWTDATWNPTIGCTRVSPGCDHCYAMRFARRFDGSASAYLGTTDGPDWSGKVNLLGYRLEDPLRWRKPRRIFVNSMSDLFHDTIPDSFIDEVFDVMESREASHHTFQILTKRHARMRAYMQGRMRRRREYADKFDLCPTEAMRNSPAAQDARRRAETPTPNIWLGVSVEDQRWADIRIPALLETPAAVRWISAEPLLGPIDLEMLACTSLGWNVLDVESLIHPPLDWVVVGGESGPGARPIDPEWARALRDQCVTSEVPFLFKQWGGVRKHNTGRHLDGQLHDGYPERAA